MSENRSSNEKAQKIDITKWVDRFLHSFFRLWWLVIIICAAFGVYKYNNVKNYYVPNFTAEATLTISSTSQGQEMGSESYTNVQKAEQLQKVFSSIASSGILDDMIAEDMGLTYVPGSYNVQSISGTNMLTITATANNGEDAYAILQSVIRNYPDVAQMVVGQTYSSVLDDSGIPEDTGIATNYRGSVIRGVFIGLILSCLILLLDMIIQRTVRYESDITHILHAPCLGKLPKLRMKARKKGKTGQISILEENISFEYLEAVRTLRSRLERRMEKYGEKTILVTSSVPSEGKSTIAANLAAAFGRKGKKVILVDCDIRHPSVQQRLGIEGDYPGLEAILRGEASFRESLYKVHGMDVYVLCGSKTSSENIKILGSPEMKEMIEQLEEVADVVILDTSPSALLADAITLAVNVPLALYVIRSGYVKIRNVLDGIDELADTGIRIVGCVLNFSDEASASRSTSRKYGTYGSYGQYGSESSRSRRFGRKEEEIQYLDGQETVDVSQMTDEKIGWITESEAVSIEGTKSHGPSAGKRHNTSSDTLRNDTSVHEVETVNTERTAETAVPTFSADTWKNVFDNVDDQEEARSEIPSEDATVEEAYEVVSEEAESYEEESYEDGAFEENNTEAEAYEEENEAEAEAYEEEPYEEEFGEDYETEAFENEAYGTNTAEEEAYEAEIYDDSSFNGTYEDTSSEKDYQYPASQEISAANPDTDETYEDDPFEIEIFDDEPDVDVVFNDQRLFENDPSSAREEVKEFDFGTLEFHDEDLSEGKKEDPEEAFRFLDFQLPSHSEPAKPASDENLELDLAGSFKTIDDENTRKNREMQEIGDELNRIFYKK